MAAAAFAVRDLPQPGIPAEHTLWDVHTERLRAVHIPKDPGLYSQPVLQILESANILDGLLHRHHLEDAGLFDHLLFLAEHHWQIPRTDLSVLAHDERKDVVDLRLRQSAQVHDEAFKQFLCGRRSLVDREEVQYMLAYLLRTEVVRTHERDIRLECAWDDAERREQDDGAVVHRAARDSLGNAAQTRDDTGRLEFSYHILKDKDLTREILFPQYRVECSAQRRRIAESRPRILIAAVQTPLDDAAPLLRRKLSEDVLYLPVFECVNIENGKSSIHILLKFLAKYRLIVHGVPSFPMRLTSYG